MKNKISKFIYWTPRILGIVFVLWLMLFSLDIFEPGLTASQIALGLLMHNLPALALLLVLIISWKHELIGGIVFILAGLAYIILLALNQTFAWYMLSWALLISGPAWLVGILFLVGWRKKRRLAT